MPNATDPPRNRTMRGTLSILVLAAAIAAGSMVRAGALRDTDSTRTIRPHRVGKRGRDRSRRFPNGRLRSLDRHRTIRRLRHRLVGRQTFSRPIPAPQLRRTPPKRRIPAPQPRQARLKRRIPTPRPPTDAIQSTDSGGTEATRQIAAVEEADRSGTQALVLLPAPEDTIEQVPVDAPPVTDTAGETDILATVDRTFERIETAIREQLAAEPRRRSRHAG